MILNLDAGLKTNERRYLPHLFLKRTSSKNSLGLVHKKTAVHSRTTVFSALYRVSFAGQPMQDKRQHHRHLF